MKSYHRVSKEEREQMLQLRAEGKSNCEIADILGRSWQSVVDHIGVQQKQRPHTVVDGLLVMRMLKMREHGMSNAQIAKDMGMATKTVRKYIGNQPKNNRSDYGCLKTQPVDQKYSDTMMGKEVPETVVISEEPVTQPPVIIGFNPQPKPEPKRKAIGLPLISNNKIFGGEWFDYEVDYVEHSVTLMGKVAPFVDNKKLCIDFAHFYGMLNELMELTAEVPEP